MLRATVHPESVSGDLTIPPSKSCTIRLLALSLLHKGRTTILHAGDSDDEQGAIKLIRQMGAEVKKMEDGSLEIHSNGFEPKSLTIDCGESALCARMFAAIAALGEQQVLINGRGSLLKRKMEFPLSVQKVLQFSIIAEHGFLPLRVKGPMVPKDFILEASDTSQFVSGLLMALAASTNTPIRMRLINPVSTPYIALTVSLMKDFGFLVEMAENYSFIIHPRENTAGDIMVRSEGDWSSAAFMLVAGAVSGEVKLKGLKPGSLQADRKLLQALEQAGVDIEINEYFIAVRQPDHLLPFQFDARHCPDLFPSLCVLASCCEGESLISGIGRLSNKESDRLKSLTEMMHRFSIEYKLNEDSLHITGGQLKSCEVDSFSDHRIAMAASVAALRADGPVNIHNAGVVSKSYPDFFEHLRTLGASVSLVSENISA